MKKMLFRRFIFVLLFCLSFIMFQSENVFATEKKDPSLPITCNITGVVQSLSVLRQTTYGTDEFTNTYNIYLVSLKITDASNLTEKVNIYDVKATKAKAKNETNLISTSTPCSTIINTEQRIIIKDILSNEKLPFSPGQNIRSDINYQIDYFDSTYYYYAFDVKLVDANNNEIDLTTAHKLVNKYKVILTEPVKEEDGNYVITGLRPVKLFGLFPVKMNTIIKINAKFDESLVIGSESVSSPWWRIFVRR